MFALQHINKSFRDKTVLEDVSFAVNYGEVVALIGENGAGKTTLLRIILGELTSDGGVLNVSQKGIGYVPQSPRLKTSIKDSFDSATEPWQIDYALSQVGLDGKSPTTLVSDLSGGQRTRLAFAVVLAMSPSTLLLDEPTNNLDASGLKWLASFIKRFKGSILLVSHDRAFINQTASKILELDKGVVRVYGGNYDFYREQKQAEEATAIQIYEKNHDERRRLARSLATQREKSHNTQEHIKRDDHDTAQRDFFRNRVSTKFGQTAKALQARIDQLEDVPRPEMPPNYKVSLSGEVPNTKLILNIDKVHFSFPSLVVLKEVNLVIRGSERCLITGHNGAGKTTLLKIGAGLLEPNSGQRAIGDGVSFGYFSQDTDGLDYALTGLDNLRQSSDNLTTIYRESRSLGLSEKDLHKKPDELSRGQQAKLAFAKLLLGKNQLLILDEPTNHLDIPTREKIEAALTQYRGAILVSSHDSYFTDKLNIDRHLELKAGKLQ